MADECQIGPLLSWLAALGAVSAVGIFFAGAAWATAKAERMIRGGRRPIR
jgi:hypothetical protein